MKGATLLTNDPTLIDSAVTSLGKLGFQLSFGGGYVQAIRERCCVMVHPTRPIGAWKSNVDTSVIDIKPVEDLGLAYYVECFWETLFCEIVKELAKRAEKPFFVLSECGVFAPADVTPSKMSL